MGDEVQVEVITSAADFPDVYDCVSACFGTQIHDAIWVSMNPGWDTPQGKDTGVSHMVKQWRNITSNSQGRPNKIFLKATVPSAEDPKRRQIVGMATWAQLSFVAGQGDEPTDTLDGDAIHPENPSEARFTTQIFRGLVRKRVETVREKTAETPPATFVLDMCAVDPVFQRRGIASRLTQWGLEEAQRRGLEATTEASEMGRHVYEKFGFKPILEIDYGLDEEFSGRSVPPNLFMRTGKA